MGSKVVIPEALRRMLSLVVTIAAAVLYALVLGSAVVRTIVEGDPAFSEGAVRAASLLSGLVGSVVSAGFASSQKSRIEPVEADRPRVRRPTSSLASRNLESLARTLGFLPLASRSSERASREADEAAPVQESPLALWVALLYVAVYFLVGVSCVALVIIKDTVPELIGNAAWVCMGTVISSAYAFFALNAE